MSTANEPAFPTPCGTAVVTDYHPGHGDVRRTVDVCATGLTRREYFAAKAMQGLLASSEADDASIAKYSVALADALIRELEKEGAK